MSFQTLGLSDALLRAIADQGYTVPTPIQREAIPAVLAGGDLLAAAQTGTGKTAGFVLPMLHRLSSVGPHASGPRKPLRALILTPTRELAAQVEASVRTYGSHLKLTSMALFGGVGLAPQTARLKRGIDILVATPGRLLDHHRQRNVDLSRIEFLVLDEADRMLDMGFITDIKRVLSLLPSQRQSLLFSATFSAEIRLLAQNLLKQPRTIDVAVANPTIDAITQRVHPVNRGDKSKLLAWLVGHHRWRQVLVFTRTKHGADKLVDSLQRDGIGAVALHGNKSQNARTRALADFKSGNVEVLVATDIAARGIDIDQLPHVVNYELPNTAEDYIHRIGRTGRAGADGEAISLVCVDEHLLLRGIERLLKRSIPRDVVPGFEPDPHAVAQPITLGRGYQSRATPNRVPGRPSSPAYGGGMPPAGPRSHRGTPKWGQQRQAEAAPASRSSSRQGGSTGERGTPSGPASTDDRTKHDRGNTAGARRRTGTPGKLMH